MVVLKWFLVVVFCPLLIELLQAVDACVAPVVKAKKLRFRKIESWTSNFDVNMIVGQGGFGKIYMGQWENQLVALKRRDTDSYRTQFDFENEIEMLNGLRHENIIRLLASCNEGVEKILVYEWMPFKSLHQQLHGGEMSLDWNAKGYFRIVGSCNGILCLFSKKYGFSLWNPSIRRKLTIPEDPYWGQCFAMWGFGFDPTTDDYKIVRICYYQFRGVKESYVYSMRAGTWFEVASPATRICIPKSELGCFVNGVLHWIVKDFMDATKNVLHHYILTLDLSSHIFGTIALPQPSWEATRLMIINGSLGVFFGDRSILVMRIECNNTPSDWPVVYKFNSNERRSAKVLQLPATGDLLIHSLYDREISVLPKTREESKLVKFNDSSFKVEMKMFVKSLELLDVVT